MHNTTYKNTSGWYTSIIKDNKGHIAIGNGITHALALKDAIATYQRDYSLQYSNTKLVPLSQIIIK